MTSAAPLLTVATVLYGGEDTLALTLPTWAGAMRDLPVSVLFVDNSEDAAARTVVERQPWRSGAMTYVHNPTNVGFAAGANRALREAGSASVFLLNPDVTLRGDELASLLALAPDPTPRAVSLVTNGKVTAGIDVNPIGWFSDRPASSAVACLGPSGGAALLDRTQFLELGGFTEQLFAWGEDAGLALRLWTRGVRTQVIDLRLDHLGGHSVASITGLRRKALWLARNRVWILRAQYSLPYRVVVGPPFFGMLVLNGLRKIPSRTAAAYFHGLLHGLRVAPPWHDSMPMTLRAHIAYRRTKRRGPEPRREAE